MDLRKTSSDTSVKSVGLSGDELGVDSIDQLGYCVVRREGLAAGFDWIARSSTFQYLHAGVGIATPVEPISEFEAALSTCCLGFKGDLCKLFSY